MRNMDSESCTCVCHQSHPNASQRPVNAALARLTNATLVQELCTLKCEITMHHPDTLFLRQPFHMHLSNIHPCHIVHTDRERLLWSLCINIVTQHVWYACM